MIAPTSRCRRHAGVVRVRVHDEVHPREDGLADPRAVRQAQCRADRAAAPPAWPAATSWCSGRAAGRPGRSRTGRTGRAAQEQPQPCAARARRSTPVDRLVQRVRVGGEQLGRAGSSGSPPASAARSTNPAGHPARWITSRTRRPITGMSSTSSCSAVVPKHAEEPVLAGDRRPRSSNVLTPDVVRVHRPVHGGGRTSLGKHQQLRASALASGPGPRSGCGGKAVPAQHAEPGREHRAQRGRWAVRRVIVDFQTSSYRR